MVMNYFLHNPGTFLWPLLMAGERYYSMSILKINRRGGEWKADDYYYKKLI